MDDDSVARSRWYMWSRGQLVQVVIVRGTALVGHAKKCYTEDFFRGLTFQRNFEQISLKLVPADESLKFGGSC